MMMHVVSSMTPEVKLLAVLKVWSEVLRHYDSWGEAVYGSITPDRLSVVLWFPRGSCLWLLMKSCLQYYDSWWKVACGTTTSDEKLPAVLQLLMKCCLQYYDSWWKVACGTITPVEKLSATPKSEVFRGTDSWCNVVCSTNSWTELVCGTASWTDDVCSTNSWCNAVSSTVILDVKLSAAVEAVVVDRFYIALSSTLEQTLCARMWLYMSD